MKWVSADLRLVPPVRQQHVVKAGPRQPVLVVKRVVTQLPARRKRGRLNVNRQTFVKLRHQHNVAGQPKHKRRDKNVKLPVRHLGPVQQHHALPQRREFRPKSQLHAKIPNLRVQQPLPLRELKRKPGRVRGEP